MSAGMSWCTELIKWHLLVGDACLGMVLEPFPFIALILYYTFSLVGTFENVRVGVDMMKWPDGKAQPYCDISD